MKDLNYLSPVLEALGAIYIPNRWRSDGSRCVAAHPIHKLVGDLVDLKDSVPTLNTQSTQSCAGLERCCIQSHTQLIMVFVTVPLTAPLTVPLTASHCPSLPSSLSVSCGLSGVIVEYVG